LAEGNSGKFQITNLKSQKKFIPIDMIAIGTVITCDLRFFFW